MYAKVCNSLLSKHVVDVLEDIVVNKASSLRSILEDKSNGIGKDKDLVSKYVKEFIYEIMEHMYSLLSKDDRQLLFNDIAKQFNVKVNDENQINKPLHIELVKDNFNSIMSALKFYEQK
jgi:F0F1-type ATP synthase delta subunit